MVRSEAEAGKSGKDFARRPDSPWKVLRKESNTGRLSLLKVRSGCSVENRLGEERMTVENESREATSDGAAVRLWRGWWLGPERGQQKGGSR